MKQKCKCCGGRRGTGLPVLHRLPPGLIEFGQCGQPGKVKAVLRGLSDGADLPENSCSFYKAQHSKVQAERLACKNLLAVLVMSKFRSLNCLQPVACILHPCPAVQMAPGIHRVVADLTDSGWASQRDTVSLNCVIWLPSL